MQAIGIEKYAIPTPIGTIPEGKQNSDQVANFEAALQNFTAHEKSYILKPPGDWAYRLRRGAGEGRVRPGEGPDGDRRRGPEHGEGVYRELPRARGRELVRILGALLRPELVLQVRDRAHRPDHRGERERPDHQAPGRHELRGPGRVSDPRLLGDHRRGRQGARRGSREARPRPRSSSPTTTSRTTSASASSSRSAARSASARCMAKGALDGGADATQEDDQGPLKGHNPADPNDPAHPDHPDHPAVPEDGRRPRGGEEEGGR
jgi:hypothetical protein